MATKVRLYKKGNCTFVDGSVYRVTINHDAANQALGRLEITSSDQAFETKVRDYADVVQEDGVTPIGTNSAEVETYLSVNVSNFNTASGGSGAGTNPTSGLMPYNSGGSFADTSLEIGSIFGSPTYKFKDSTKVNATYFTDTFLNLDYSVNEYSFGIASFSGGIPSADIGMAMTGMRMVIGGNMQGGTEGIIRANGNTGVVSIGAFGVEYALGVNPFGGGVLIGSGFMETIPPANSTVPAIWIWVTNENGVQYKVAAYQ
jgi:hypothetical protein